MTRQPPKDPIIAIVGATGTGKSQLAVALAKRYNGEVVNADSMQLYDGLPIITNKITTEEQQGIPHHLLGCVGIHEPTWVVGTFAKKALQTIDEIRSRGKLPILVGGTHYYTQSLLFKDRLAEEPRGDEGKKEFIPDTAERWPILKEPTSTLLEELKRVDPVMADRWHPNDRRKIQRSLEIYLQTGSKASEIYAEQRRRGNGDTALAGGDPTSDGPTMRFNTLLFWIHADADALRDRLDSRVDRMLDQGLLKEVRALDNVRATQLANGSLLDESKGIWVSIGYKEFKAYTQALDRNECDEKRLQELKGEAVERTKISTRQYAKRQIRWIRIKLANALANADAIQGFYLLDGSDVSEFDQDVMEPALRLTQQFLTAAPMPDPSTLSPTAAEMLTPKRDYDLSLEPERWTKQYCSLCDVTCVTNESWNMHLKSKAHRRLLAQSKKNRQDASAVEDLPRAD